jgi:hypothetical protein
MISILEDKSIVFDSFSKEDLKRNLEYFANVFDTFLKDAKQ